MARLAIGALLAFGLAGFVPSEAQAGQCDKQCVQTVRDLLEGRKHGISTSWFEKANRRLGDGVSIGIRKLFPGKRISEPKNVKLFLPLIREAFQDTDMIAISQNRTPLATLKLLHDLATQAGDPALKKEITETRDEIIKLTGHKT